MIALVEGASRRKTPNEIALSILLASLTLIFLLAVVTLAPMAAYAGAQHVGGRPGRPAGLPDPDHDRCPAVRDRHRRHGPTRASQRAGHVRPGGRGRRRREHPAAGQDRHHHLRQPSGRRLPARARRRPDAACATRPGCPAWPTRRRRAARSSTWRWPQGARRRATCPRGRDFVEFTAQTRMSGVDLADGPADPQGCGLGGAGLARRLDDPTEVVDAASTRSPPPAARRWWWPADRPATAPVLGVIHLKDVVKHGMRERFAQLRAMGIRTVMITGDNAADREGDRRRGRGRRLPGRGHAGGQDGLIKASRPAAGWSR